MSDDRQRIDAITAEKLISGARAGAPTGSDQLADLLAAAANPARRAELTGEEAAVMAFRRARVTTAPESRRRSMLKSALAKVATAKAAIVLAAVGGGGVALAAGSGHLPGVGTSDHHTTGRPATSVTTSDHAAASAAEHGSSSAAAENHSATPRASHAPSGSPSPNLRGLCTAFNAGAGDNPGKALENPAFTVLINTAGDKNTVAAFCATLLNTPAGKSSTHPGEASDNHPSPHPTDAPSSHPSRPDSTPSHPSPTRPTTPGH
jgi:hypothetical protein